MCKLGGNTAGRHVFHTIQTHVCRKILRPKLAHKQTKGSMRLQTVLVHNNKRQNRREWQSLHSLNTKSKPDVWKIFISILSLRHKELYTVYCRGCTSNHYTSDYNPHLIPQWRIPGSKRKELKETFFNNICPQSLSVMQNYQNV